MDLFLVCVFALVGFLPGYIILLTIYRLFFHPFAKYPGPFWAKISYFYAFYHAWYGSTGISQKACHDRYGHIVRYAPDNLIFDEPEAIKDIHSVGKHFNKGKTFAPMNMNPGHWNLAFTPHKREHGRRRRIISQGFSDRAVKESQPYVKEHIDKLCQLLLNIPVCDDKWTKPVDLEHPLFWLATDMVTDLVFGESFNLLSKSDYRSFAQVLRESLRRNSLISQYPHIFQPGVGKWLDFSTWFLPSAAQKMMQIMKVGAATAMKRIESPPTDADQRRDILSYLIDSTDPETGTRFPSEEIITEAIVLLLAGGDTTSMATRTLFFYLANNQDAYEKLIAEIRSMFTSFDEIHVGDKLDSCTYLHACIQEGLRLFAGPASWRDAEEGGAKVLDEWIPEGLTVGVSQYALVHRADIFPKPFQYIPERWIPGGSYSDEQIKEARSASPRFSIGPRSCVAKPLAMSMLQLTTACILWNMDMKPAEGEAGSVGRGGPHLGPGRYRTDEFQLYGSFTLHASGPVVQLRPRALK